MISPISRNLLKLSFFLTGSLPLAAQLPMVSNGAWLGQFAVLKDRRAQFTVGAADLATALKAVSKDGSVMDWSGISISFAILQTLPDGTSTVHALNAETLKTASPATADLQRVDFQGRTTGDATLEISLEKCKGGIKIEGRIVEAGTMPKETLKPVVLLRIPSMYPNEMQNKGEWTKAETKDFEKRVSKDKAQLKWADGSSKSLDPFNEIDPEMKKRLGAGVVSADMEFSSWQDRAFKATAEAGSSMSMTMTGPALLHEGLEIRCAPDSLKNTNNTLGLHLVMK